MKLFGGTPGDAGEALIANDDGGFAGRTYFPTLLIGLGGTGAEVLLRVKKLLTDREGDRLFLHRFLFVDTDLRTFAPREGLPDIERNEQCLIGVRAAEALIRNPKLHPYILERFPRTDLKESFIRGLARGMGASQIRSLGALAYALDYQNVRTQMQAAFESTQNLSQTAQQVLANENAVIGTHTAIYVVGSLAGGTGSGCFLDAALTIKDVCHLHGPKLVGLFALPQGFDEKVKGDPAQLARTRANTYAALKELQFVLDADASGRPAKIEYDYGSAGRLSLDAADSLFALTYLFDVESKRGRLPSIENLYELMARTIYQDVGSAFGAQADSFNSNCGVLNQTQVCPETGRNRPFSAAATSSLLFPAERVAMYCTLRSLAEVLHDELLERPVSLQQAEKEAGSFLDRHRLEERGTTDQIITELLTDSKQGFELSSESHGLSNTWGQRYGHRDFVAKIKTEWQRFETSALPEVAKVVSANQRARLHGTDPTPRDRIANEVDTWIRDVAAAHGVAFALATLREATAIVDKIGQELSTEIAAWNTTDRRRSEERFDELCVTLSGMNWVKRRTQADENGKENLIRQFNGRVKSEFGAIARTSAVEIVLHLRRTLDTATTRWNGMYGVLHSLVEKARDRARRLETNDTGSVSDFVVEMEVTPPGYERTHYEENRPKTSAVLGNVLSLFGTGDDAAQARLDMLAWLLEMSERSGGMEMIGERLGQRIYESFWKELLATDIIEFIRTNKALVGEGLEARLTLLFDMCQPFWPARAIQSGMTFPDFTGVTVKHAHDAKGNTIPPKIVKDWITKHGSGAAGANTSTISTSVPYEVMLSRRTHGARAYYLGPARTWAMKYDQARQEAKSRFMMETHVAFRSIPDIFPHDAKPIEYFALGVALGLIAVRGDFYYFALTVRPSDAGSLIVASHESQWRTVRDLETGVEVPVECGRLLFNLKASKTIPKKYRLGQGRENAIEGLASQAEWVALLEEAVNEYHQAVGNSVMRLQLRAYIEEVLDPAIEKDGARARVLIEERRLIEERMATVGM